MPALDEVHFRIHMALAWLWIPIALVITVVIAGSLVVMTYVEHHRHEREIRLLEGSPTPSPARVAGRHAAA